MSNKIYSDRMRADAVDLVVLEKRSAAAVARELGVGTSTVQRWVVAALESGGTTLLHAQAKHRAARQHDAVADLRERLAALDARLTVLEQQVGPSTVVGRACG